MDLGQDAAVRWAAPEGPWTEPDLHLFPQGGHRYEIVDGCLHAAPPADELHELITTSVTGVLRAAAPSGWWACSRPGLQIGASNVVPDVAVLRPGSSGATWADPRDIALIVEVETPSTRRYDRLLKAELYAEGGIGSYWRIERDGRRSVAHVYRLSPQRRYGLEHSVAAGSQVTLDEPYRVVVSPASWLP